MKSAFTALLLSALWVPALSISYSLRDTVTGSGFFDFFEFQAISDPTHGRVNYVDANTARSRGLAVAQSSNSFILRADSNNVLNPGGAGRDSVRVRSRNTYSHHVAVFDIHHMPEGCGTWPAVWETQESIWPNGGEVDIVEGVNNQSPNAATLHTNQGCTMPSSRQQTGQSTQLDCNVAVNGNSGCGVRFPTSNSFGPSFNSNGGGWFAMERSSTNIKVFFWPRNSGSVPNEVRNGAGSVNPDNWGTPIANFPNSQCNLDSHFSAHNIIINLTFCGDWAGSVYGQSGCPGSCVDFVNNNPGSFRNAFFDLGSIRVYQ
ncbi:hypothetical protein AGABI2DRAFT_195916 [Agaricus bisporus var. bisporus H97]|uniref:hypothetical protein n=1 Tax=Agaricus bisporus var. bisporus (strain H97 / ATCC MYA-4626 / FGSC 10389) TaxID=936046 RepID=UPI00029F6D61|nr:hypothetical protein AGABI2DRAFT_195916 [Agaricus bisporus var. bisporus H97]EKV42126.1 hypothetical protein AGABI2DRAFT_195916 [Agaricus bisporus var. bisporus H97]